MMLLRASLLALLVLPVAVPASAEPVATGGVIELAQASDSIGRKGTRNYRPGELSTTTPAESAEKSNGELSANEKLTQCMETWDAGTHITKSHWREICQRQLNDR